jgi:hypothetical protein
MSGVVLGRSRSGRVVRLALLLALMTGGAAYATTGSTANPRSVIFYYGETAGAGDSDNFSGYGAVTMCMNSNGAPVGNGNTYVGDYRLNRTLQPDDVIKSVNWGYRQGQYQSGNFNTSSDKKYHTRSGWSAVPSAPDWYKGYVASRQYPNSCIWP